MPSKKALDTLRTSLQQLRHQAEQHERLKPMRAFDFARYRRDYEAALAANGREKLLEKVLENAERSKAEWPEDREHHTKS